MFTPKRRRRFGYEIEQEKPHILWRVMIVAVILGIAWWSSIKIGKFFETASGNRTAVTLFIEEGQTGVQVALQGDEWQKGETRLKLYEGDAVRTGSVASATLACFDGTILYLDKNTEIMLEESTKREKGTSTLGMTIRRGRAWIASGKDASSTVVRTIKTNDVHLQVNNATHAIIGTEKIAVIQEPSEGLLITLEKKPYTTFTIGEGQGWSISDEARGKMATGESPYTFRDPLSLATMQDPFITEGIQQTEKYASVHEEVSTQVSSSTSSSEESMTTAMTILSPKNGDIITTPTVIVRGMVSARVAQVNINNSIININSDRTVNAEVKIEAKDPSPVIHIEAMNAEGIILAKEDRTLVNNITPPSFPAVKIIAPVGSGQTLTTSEQIVEIAGETAENTQAILVNDYALQLFKKGKRTWSYLANSALGNLKLGKNTFTIVAVGPDTVKSAPRTITIELTEAKNTGTGAVTSPPLKQNPPLEAGSLSVQSPSAGTEGKTTSSELSLLGKTSQNTASISVNGYTLSLYQKESTDWKYIASVERGTMKRGRNVYRIVARNDKGEILDILEYTLTFEP